MNRAVVGGMLRVLSAAGALALAGCGAPTPYQAALDGQGYAEQALEENRFRVTFSGNTLTPRETVENYLLYRAAEVTLERGYDHFVVVDAATERSTIYHSTVTGFANYHPFQPFPRGYHPFYHDPLYGGVGGATAWPQDRYSAYANIVMRKGEKPPDDLRAYDARAVLERLAPTVAPAPVS